MITLISLLTMNGFRPSASLLKGRGSDETHMTQSEDLNREWDALFSDLPLIVCFYLGRQNCSLIRAACVIQILSSLFHNSPGCIVKCDQKKNTFNLDKKKKIINYLHVVTNTRLSKHFNAEMFHIPEVSWHFCNEITVSLMKSPTLMFQIHISYAFSTMGTQ